MNLTVLDRPAWSATRLKMFLTCPRQFRYAYVDGIPTVPTAPLVFGRVLHEVLCFLHEHQMVERHLPPVPEVSQQFDRLWSQALEAEQPFFRSGAPSPEMHRTIAHEVLRAYLSSPENGRPPLLVELAFEVEAAGHRLCGIIDRVDEGESGLIIVDFKSGARKPPLPEIERDLQFTLYAFAAERVLGKPVEQVVHYHLRDGSRLPTQRGESHFAWLLDDLLPHVMGNVEHEHYPPRRGYWCSFCDFREICRVESSVVSDEPKGESSRVDHQDRNDPKDGEQTWPTRQS